MQQMAKSIVAAFDFDGTLTRHDTLLPFLFHVVGISIFSFKFILLLPTLAAYVLGVIRNDKAKEKVLRCFLADMNMETLQRHGLHFAKNKIPALLRNEAVQRLQWHKQQGHRCMLVSASLEIYLRPWANTMEFDDILGTRLELLTDGRISGNFQGENCFGIEKVKRLNEILGARENYTLYAYGDSRGDKELLSAADFPFYKTFSNQGQPW